MDLHSASSVVLQVLTQASSQDSALLKPAEEQLKQWETQPGFYTVLLNLFTNHSLDVNVRWLAVLYFKNGIERYWRRVAPNALTEEEKSALRAGLISNFNEPVNQIATQIAVLIAKVARLDCPKHWPELIPTLIEAVKVQDDLRQHRALLTFYHVTKTLSSKRLAADRKLFQNLASEIYTFACCLWNHHADTFLQQICSGGDPTAVNSLERASLSLKCLLFIWSRFGVVFLFHLIGIFDLHSLKSNSQPLDDLAVRGYSMAGTWHQEILGPLLPILTLETWQGAKGPSS